VPGCSERSASARGSFTDDFGWEPEMLMSGISYEETVTIFETAGGRLLVVAPENAHPGGVMSRTYFVAPHDGITAGRSN
jgi:hypothetical protein